MFLDGKKPVQAKLVGNTLVATFRNSNPNLIWKFDLERNHSFTVALQGDEGDFELGMTSLKGEFYPIARFASREDADEAFSAVQKILMKRRQGRLKALFVWVCGLALMILVVMMVGRYVINSFSSGSPPSALSASVPKIRNGVPLPADQVLRPPP